MNRAFTVVAWTLVIAAAIAVAALWIAPPRAATVDDGWRESADVDYV